MNMNEKQKLKNKSETPTQKVLQKIKKIKGKKNLLDLLEEKDLIDQEGRKLVEEEVKKTNLSVERVIKEKGLVTERALAQALGEFLGVEYIELESRAIYPNILRLIPHEVAVYYQMIAFDREGSKLRVAMVDPENFKALEALEFATARQGLNTEIYIVTEPGLEQALRQYDKSLKEEVSKALERVAKVPPKEKKVLEEREKEIRKLVEAAPISKIVQVIIRHAVEGGASDIHIEPREDMVRVRYRIDGILRTILSLPAKIKESIVSRVKIMSDLQIDETRIPQDGRIRLEIKGQPIDFRVSTLPTVNGEKVVMRILKTGTKIFSLEELGLSGLRLQHVQEEIKKSNGMLLVTGPTGSGKSTTLYSILGILNQEGVNIVTLEDPVEYFIPGVAQSQVHPKVGLTFATGLRSILRQDPDIIMVGEIRDEETAEMAVHASLTGHVVLSTLHTNSAVGAVPRLIDMGVQPFLITASVNIVIAQRLVRKICERCREAIEVSPETKKLILEEWQKIPDSEKKGIDLLEEKILIYRGKGCKHCSGEGYKGRIGIFEAVPVSADFQEMILSKPSESKIRTFVREQGFINMKQDGVLKALQGMTTLEEVFRVTKN